MGLVIFVPATAMEAMIDFPLWGSVIITGTVATIYTTLVSPCWLSVWSDSIDSLSLRSVSRRRSRLHKCTPCRSIPSASPCWRQAKIERVQIVLNRSQPGLPGSSGSASPVFEYCLNSIDYWDNILMQWIVTPVNTQQWAQPITDGVYGISSRKLEVVE